MSDLPESEFFVQAEYQGVVSPISIFPDVSIGGLKHTISKKLGITPDSVELFLFEERLDEDLKIKDTNISFNDIIQVIESREYKEYITYKTEKGYSGYFEDYIRDSHRAKSIWNSIDSDFLDKYMSHPDHIFDIKSYLLLFEVMLSDKKQSFGECFEEENYEFCEFVKPGINRKYDDTGLCSYFGYLFESPEDYLFDEIKDSTTRSDIKNMLRTAESANWGCIYSSSYLTIYSDGTPTNILVINEYEKGAICLQYDNKYVYIARECHFSCLYHNNYSLSCDNVFENGFYACIRDNSVCDAFGNLFGMCDEQSESEQSEHDE